MLNAFGQPQDTSIRSVVLSSFCSEKGVFQKVTLVLKFDMLYKQIGVAMHREYNCYRNGQLSKFDIMVTNLEETVLTN